MFSKIFNRKKKVDQAVQLPPERFSFMPQNEQSEFQDEVTRYFQNNHPELIIDFTKGAIYESDEREQQYGLDTVAQMYHQSDKKQKREIVKNHFNSIFKAKKEEEKILKDIENFNKMKKLLAIRLYPSDYEPFVYEGLIYRHDIEGIYTVLVLDLPSSAINIKPETAKKWGVNIDELFKIGLENTFRNNKVKIAQNKLIDNLSAWSIMGDGIYTATFVLKIETYPQLIGKYGSLVIIPHRHAVVIYPVEDIGVIQMTRHMPILASSMFREGPGSITPNFYWYQKGKFMQIPYQLDMQKKNFSITPPEEFVEVMNIIAEKEEQKNK